jgi:uncharacterized protein
MSELADFRKMKDTFFKENYQSPLDQVERASFTGLKYYPENPELCFDLALEKFPKPEKVIMPTSTGDQQDYWHIGRISFPVKDQIAVLHVYLAVDGGEYFLPFVDATAPLETYGGGRYLEPDDLGDGQLHVDFNLAYNPYCAYNDRWSCPVPPPENRLAVRIEAGEKLFHE